MVASIEHRGAYRPEIDGLRAVAVISVILYHIERTWLPGGYVGVDIFFVISGFLITSIIWRELAHGTFSIGDFYLRRIRRIIPVMLVVVSATLVAGMLLLLPDALERLSLSAIYSVVSAANIYFWRHLDDGYFAEASDQEPLLHLWSLGVEEQFYLVWPVLLLLLAASGGRRRGGALAGAAVIAIASFAFAEWTNEADPKLAYFMLPTRAGELMVGALLALSIERGKATWLRSPFVAEGIGLAGLSAIAGSLVLLDDLSPFPGINALYPCAGAALIILAGSESRVLRYALANRIAVGVGLISYSLYLWHWPILAFLRYFFGSISSAQAVAAGAAMLSLSFLSYRYVELPARRVGWSGRRQALLLFVIPGLIVSLAAAYVVRTDGLKSRIESSAGFKRLEDDTAPAFEFEYNCQVSSHDPGILTDPRCLIGSPSPRAGAPRVLLWGDSHAAHHVGLLDVIGRHGGFRIRNASHSSCPPVFGGSFSYGRYKAGCAKFQPFIRQHILAGTFDVVVLGAAWSSYERLDGFQEALVATIEEIRRSGVRVVLLGRVPVQSSYHRHCDRRWVRIGRSRCSEQAVPNTSIRINDLLASIAAEDPGVAYLEVGSAICGPESCPAYLDGVPIYFDKSHLSMRGSMRIGEHLISTGRASAWISAISGIPEVAAADGEAGTSRSSPVPPPLPAADPMEERLFRGIALRVPYTIISDVGSVQDGRRLRKIVLEFEKADSRFLGAQVSRQMAQEGFRATGSRSVRGGQRSNFRADGGLRATILVLPRGLDNTGEGQVTGSMEVILSRPAGDVPVD